MKITNTVGIDEVGRGPLAGPVTVCAVHWLSEENPETIFGAIKDSKRLTPKQRTSLAEQVMHRRNEIHLRYGVHSVDAEKIDQVGIMQALARAAEGAIAKMGEGREIPVIHADYGLPIPKQYQSTQSIKGDEKNPVIALASVVAKVTRDRIMIELAEQYPQYGFEKNKGYGTKQHREHIQKNGITKIHRKTFLQNICYNPEQE